MYKVGIEQMINGLGDANVASDGLPRTVHSQSVHAADSRDRNAGKPRVREGEAVASEGGLIDAYRTSSSGEPASGNYVAPSLSEISAALIEASAPRLYAMVRAVVVNRDLKTLQAIRKCQFTIPCNTEAAKPALSEAIDTIDANGDTLLISLLKNRPKGATDRARHNAVWIAMLLLDADVKLSDSMGNTAALIAIKYSYPLSMIKLLLRPDIINHMDNTGETALSTAVAFSNEGLVEMLLERGALPTLRASPGAHSALQSAWCQPGYTNDSIREMLRKAVSKQEFAQIAVHGSDAVSAEQQAFAAARSGDRKTLERLLKTQPSLLQATTEAGHTLMMLATIHGKLDLAKLLCDNGADMDAASNSRDTALLYAIRHGHAHVASFLIKKGADVNCRNADGCRPLAYAASKGLASTVVKLLERRADITEYLENKSLFECATKSGNLETIQVVIARLAESAKDREALNYAFVHCVYDGSGPTQDDEYLA